MRPTIPTIDKNAQNLFERNQEGLRDLQQSAHELN